MTQPRLTGNIKLNGKGYKILVDKDNNLAYERSTINEPIFAEGERIGSNEMGMLEIPLGTKHGFGDADRQVGRDAYDYATNLFMEHPDEAVCLPPPLISSKTGLSDTPVVAWEQTNSDDEIETFLLQDRQALKLTSDTATRVAYTVDKTFEGDAQPTGGCVFNNTFYAAMGGLSTDRFIRTRSRGGVWSKDDNEEINVTSVADNGSGQARFTTGSSHGYSNGDKVFLSGFSVDAYNSVDDSTSPITSQLYTISAVTATTFDVTSIAYSTTASGISVRTDSDVQAEHLAIVGDLLVRAYKDPNMGWVTSRVDIVNSDPLVSANWTADIGIVTVGDSNNPINALVPFGDGEIIMKPEGVFIYRKDKGYYFNVVPELEEHAHPDNGKGAFEWKGWVYIPTIIGLLRYRNEAIEDVTPARDGRHGIATPVGPIAALTGDATRLYAVTKPFTINLNLPDDVNVGIVELDNDTVFHIPVDYTGSLFIAQNEVTLGANLGADRFQNGAIYVGCSKKFHRVFFNVVNPNTTNNGINVSYWNGTNWVEMLVRDYTKGRNNSSATPVSFGKSGDIVWNYSTGAFNLQSLPDDWEVGGDVVANAEFYYVKITVDGTGFDGTTSINKVQIGAHVDEFGLTPVASDIEIENDHAGVVYVLTAKEERGQPLIWQTLWTFAQPDFDTSSFGLNLTGGAQPVGIAAIVQPTILSNILEGGERWLFVGMENHSYFCPLGNKPDPTSARPFVPWQPFVTTDGSSFGNDFTYRNHVLVFGRTDCGLPNVDKLLTEISFDSSYVETVEVFYRVDDGNWTSLGTSSSTTRTLTAGSEPVGRMFSVAFSIGMTSASNFLVQSLLGTISNFRIKVLPRPAVNEIFEVSVELDDEQIMPGLIRRDSAEDQYGDLLTLRTATTAVDFVTPEGTTKKVHMLSLKQKATFNADNVPVLVAEIVLGVL